MIFESDFLLRALAFLIIGISLVVSGVIGGRRVDNVPLWNSSGMLFLCVCYCGFGIRFSRGISVAAELAIASLIAISTCPFAFGSHVARFSGKPRFLQHDYKLPSPKVHNLGRRSSLVASCLMCLSSTVTRQFEASRWTLG